MPTLAEITQVNRMLTDRMRKGNFNDCAKWEMKFLRRVERELLEEEMGEDHCSPADMAMLCEDPTP